MNSKLTTKTKRMLTLTTVSLVFEGVLKLPIWFLLIAYLLYVTGAGVVGWLLFILYIPAQIIAFILTFWKQKATTEARDERYERFEESYRFSNAKPVESRR